MLDQITPLILTFNEEANIGRVLERLTWAKEIVVLDSGSTDRTKEIATSYLNVRWEIRAFDCHAKQWDHALNYCQVSTPWVLALDADYVLSQPLIKEIEQLDLNGNVDGYRSCFRFLIYGKPLTFCMYPPVVTLFRRSKGKYIQDGHTQRIEINGVVKNLVEKIYHDDRKPIVRWLSAQNRYGDLEVDLLIGKKWSQLRWSNRIRKMIIIAPWLGPIYCWVFGLGFLDGWRGISYAMQRAVAETIISLKLLEKYFTSQEQSRPNA